MTRSRRLVHTVCTVFASGFLLTASAGAAREHVFVPDAGADGAAMLSGSTWIGIGPGFTLRLQRIDEAERLAFIEKVTGVRIDPFASPGDLAPRFTTFVMQLENNAAGSLDFRSQQCWLVTNKREYLNPMTIETLRSTYGVMGEPMSPAYERVGQAFVPTTRTLAPGESMSGLLVYGAFKQSTRRYKLEIQLTTPSGEVATVTAPYKRVKTESEPDP